MTIWSRSRVDARLAGFEVNQEAATSAKVVADFLGSTQAPLTRSTRWEASKVSASRFVR